MFIFHCIEYHKFFFDMTDILQALHDCSQDGDLASRDCDHNRPDALTNASIIYTYCNASTPCSEVMWILYFRSLVYAFTSWFMEVPPSPLPKRDRLSLAKL